MSALPGNEPAQFAFGRFLIDRDRRLLTRDGEPVTITPKAFDLLVVLVERGAAPVPKEELMAALWPDTAVEEGNLAFQISTLRKALGADGAGCIATLPGRGYQFVAPLLRVPDVAAPELRKSRKAWMWLGAAAIAIAALAALIAGLRSQPPSTGPSIRSLAVLPFKPLAAQRDEALELGMADTLITRLGRMPGLVVRPISAVRRYTSLDDDPLTAGKSLGVDAVVDGSIQRRGDRVRVTVRLLRTNDGTPVWTTQLDESANDLFAVQDLVAENVARAIVPIAQPQLTQHATDDLEAYQLYLQGRYSALSDPAKADELFHAAVARDPKFAAAWAAIADGWLSRGRYANASQRDKYDKARAAAEKAVALDPSLADGHAALAQVYADYDWDFHRAEEEFVRALELNPNSDVAHAQYAYLLLFRRDFDGALAHIRRATEIDPLSPIWSVIRAWVLDCSGKHDDAIRDLEATLRVHPHYVPALLHLGMAYSHAGKPELGIARLQEALAIHPGSAQLLGLMAYAQAKAGHRDAALAIIGELEKRATHETISNPNLALAFAALGDHDHSFAYLERAFAERVFLARAVMVEPEFAAMRRDPRYAALVQRLRL